MNPGPVIAVHLQELSERGAPIPPLQAIGAFPDGFVDQSVVLDNSILMPPGLIIHFRGGMLARRGRRSETAW